MTIQLFPRAIDAVPQARSIDSMFQERQRAIIRFHEIFIVFLCREINDI